MIFDYSLNTGRQEMIPITASVREAVAKSGVKDGYCLVFCPHTTAGITLNENTDPDVRYDLLLGLDRAFPNNRDFRHKEGNSAAHLKSSVVGCGVTVLIDGGNLHLGRWQAIYFCEFDGPRSRDFYVKVIG